MAVTREQWLSLPGWRRPIGCLSSVDHDSSQRVGLRSTVLEVIGIEPLTFGQIRDAVLEHWGDVETIAIAAHLRSLVADGLVDRSSAGYARRRDD